MSIIQSIRTAIPPINPAGYPFIGLFALASLALGFLSISLFWIGVGLTIWCVLFFRDPARVTPVDDSLVISPADGRVCFVGHRAAAGIGSRRSANAHGRDFHERVRRACEPRAGFWIDH